MEIYQSLILGFIQGLTEFLPVSSSGHLVIFQRFFGLMEPEIFFDVCLHIGTLVAVVIYFRYDLFTIIKAVLSKGFLFVKKDITIEEAFGDPDVKMAVLIIAGLIPTAVVGLLIDNIAEILYASILITGIMLIVTGSFLWTTRKFEVDKVVQTEFTVKKALIIGLIQGFAVIPGISRSGATIVTGLYLGLDRELSAKYSFLMSIPAIVGAAILSLRDVESLSDISLGVLLPGVLVSCITGYLALSFLVFIVKKGRLYAFAPYCWLAGITAIGFSYFWG